MNITTKFSCGDKAWVFHDGRVTQLTVGLIRPCVIDSRGARGLDVRGGVLSYSGDASEPDNYAAQQSYSEEYMCIETGIGSGSVYTLGKHIFETEAECSAAFAEVLARLAKEREERRLWERELLLASESEVRRKLARIEAAKTEAA